MSAVNHGGATVPSEEFQLNLDVHGFELDDAAPATVTADLVRDTNGAFALQIESDEQRWRIELLPNTLTGELEPVCVFANGSVIAHREDENQPGIDDVGQWLRFVIKHVTSEVGP